MTKISPDDILEGLYKLKIRESEKLKTVLELYDLEIHQKKIGPDYHRLKTMVQDVRNKNFGARNGNYERNAVLGIRISRSGFRVVRLRTLRLRLTRCRHVWKICRCTQEW